MQKNDRISQTDKQIAMESLHFELVNILKQHTSPKDNTVNLLVEIIPINKEAAYRRLRGEIQFTLEEAGQICRKLNISLDHLIEVRRDDIFSFHMSPIFPKNSMDEYYIMLEEINASLEYLATAPGGYTCGAQNTIPLEYLYKYKTLSKVNLFIWFYQVYPQSIPKNLSELVIPEKIIKKQKEHAKKAHDVSNTMILSEYCFSAFVSDIQYFASLKMISSDEISQIKRELHLVLNEMENHAATGKSSTGKKLNIYISHTFFDATYIYVYSDNYEACAMRVYGINHLSCENKKVCEDQKRWVESLIRYSTLISGSGELQRNEYFKNQRNIINTLSVI